MHDIAPGEIPVLVIDDHQMVAEVLARALHAAPGIRVVGRGGTVAEVLELVTRLRPKVVVMDYDLPDGTGADAAAAVRAELPDTEVVMLTGHADAETLGRALEAGCTGFVKKEGGIVQLVDAVRAAAAGEVVVPTDVLESLVAGTASAAAGGVELTAREREILQLLADGAGTEQIASTLVLSSHTVRNHIRNTMAKLNAHSRLQAVAVAAGLGLIRGSRADS